MIVAAKEMHEQGLSLRKIAQIHTKMGAPAKCQGRSWHPEMIRRHQCELQEHAPHVVEITNTGPTVAA